MGVTNERMANEPIMNYTLQPHQIHNKQSSKAYTFNKWYNF